MGGGVGLRATAICAIVSWCWPYSEGIGGVGGVGSGCVGAQLVVMLSMEAQRWSQQNFGGPQVSRVELRRLHAGPNNHGRFHATQLEGRAAVGPVSIMRIGEPPYISDVSRDS